MSRPVLTERAVSMTRPSPERRNATGVLSGGVACFSVLKALQMMDAASDIHPP
ncbi:hypothetical protein NKW54_03865 [Acetobacter cerevisiae]|uniref:Uncharacterized protein n=1 Tax=Acetobacter cerevisiae TaxID=178900 RepID=A0ABT1ENX1_9PROT|nr:hypothetical protein [Acetobacter cerevisiae]MCP1245074.1 hypothetical protein [Acetobacter cerevisiae]